MDSPSRMPELLERGLARLRSDVREIGLIGRKAHQRGRSRRRLRLPTNRLGAAGGGCTASRLIPGRSAGGRVYPQGGPRRREHFAKSSLPESTALHRPARLLHWHRTANCGKRLGARRGEPPWREGVPGPSRSSAGSLAQFPGRTQGQGGSVRARPSVGPRWPSGRLPDPPVPAAPPLVARAPLDRRQHAGDHRSGGRWPRRSRPDRRSTPDRRSRGGATNRRRAVRTSEADVETASLATSPARSYGR